MKYLINNGRRTLKTVFGIPRLIKNYPLWFKNRLGLNREKYSRYSLRNGLRYRVLSSSFNIINHICNHDVYKKNLIKKGDIVLDIGAQAGVFTVAASKLVGESGHIYSFEPTKLNFSILKDNLKINSLENVTPINMAVFGNAGSKEIFLDDAMFGEGSHSFYFKPKKVQKEKVKCTTIKDFFKKYKINKIDFLKMDCEGSEYEILFSTPPKILSKINRISMEVHRIKEYSIKDIVDFLKNLGFYVDKVKVFGGDFLIYAYRGV